MKRINITRTSDGYDVALDDSIVGNIQRTDTKYFRWRVLRLSDNTVVSASYYLSSCKSWCYEYGDEYFDGVNDTNNQ